MRVLSKPFEISIHAPREGSDSSYSPCRCACCHFYPRSPRGERPSQKDMWHRKGVFLSTLPARGATYDAYLHARQGKRFLSTLPARGATQCGQGSSHSSCVISIHAPREGSDIPCITGKMPPVQFLSTLPARGATWIGGHSAGQRGISIHAPREGSDFCKPPFWMRLCTFLSTLPARGATKGPHVGEKAVEFLSTLPARGATAGKYDPRWDSRFLSTLPARGATKSYCGYRL